VGENPYEMEVHPLWDVLYVANYSGKSVSVVDLSAAEVTDTIPLPETNEAGQPVDLAMSASGTFLFAACMGGDVHRIDTFELTIAETVYIELAPTQVVYSEATKCAHVPSPYGDDGIAVVCFCQ
jgi:DNA-binding beta-propeller fold protein YncE